MPRRTLTAILRTWLPWAVTAVAFVLLAVQVQRFVRAYSVDLMWWDSWGLYRPLFDGRGWWASFDLQHGPHRQGLGGWVMRVTADLTQWDTRADAAVVGWVLIGTVPLALWLAWRCGVRGLALAGVPVLVLNIRQYQLLEASSNPSHGALPLMLLVLCGLAWFAARPGVRLPLLAGVTAVAIFTGFGLFVGLIVPAMLVAEAVAAVRGRDRRRAVGCGVAVAVILLAWAAFAHGWQPDTGSDHFRFPVENPGTYFSFVGAMFANAVGLTWMPTVTAGGVLGGLVIAAVGVAVCVARGRRAWRAGVAGDPASAAVFALAAYGLLFAAYASIGRTPEGWTSAVAPRYVTHSTPLLLAVLFHLAASPRPWERWSALAMVAAVAVGTAQLHDGDVRDATRQHNVCVLWRKAYLATGTVDAANAAVRFPVNDRPVPAADLAYLRSHRLNLFDPAAWHDAARPAGTQPASR